jgi:hypothetical protein
MVLGLTAGASPGSAAGGSAGVTTVVTAWLGTDDCAGAAGLAGVAVIQGDCARAAEPASNRNVATSRICFIDAPA